MTGVQSAGVSHHNYYLRKSFFNSEKVFFLTPNLIWDSGLELRPVVGYSCMLYTFHPLQPPPCKLLYNNKCSTSCHAVFFFN